MVKRCLRLTFSSEVIAEPITYNLGQQFNLATNIRQADVTRDRGWIVLELDGEEEDIEAGIAWVISRGVRVEPAGEENNYAGDYTGSVGVAFHKDAIATLKLQDLTFNVVEQPQKFGNLLIASMACGTDILREEAAVELNTNVAGYGTSSSSAVGGEQY